MFVAGYLVTAVANLVNVVLLAYMWIIIARAILSWVNPMAAIMPVLRTLTAPLLEPIRRIMPNLGGLDLSPIVLLVLAQVAMMVLNRISFSLFGV